MAGGGGGGGGGVLNIMEDCMFLLGSHVKCVASCSSRRLGI
jgi:hypothetical protein